MPALTSYLNGCADAWAHCEALSQALSDHSRSFARRTTRLLAECAAVCLGTMEAVKEGWRTAAQFALLCVGLCEECAEWCERYLDSRFQQCAGTCRRCATLLSDLASRAAGGE